jgi:hypothetical protein
VICNPNKYRHHGTVLLKKPQRCAFFTQVRISQHPVFHKPLERNNIDKDDDDDHHHHHNNNNNNSNNNNNNNNNNKDV